MVTIFLAIWLTPVVYVILDVCSVFSHRFVLFVWPVTTTIRVAANLALWLSTITSFKKCARDVLLIAYLAISTTAYLANNSFIFKLSMTIPCVMIFVEMGLLLKMSVIWFRVHLLMDVVMHVLLRIILPAVKLFRVIICQMVVWSMLIRVVVVILEMWRYMSTKVVKFYFKTLFRLYILSNHIWKECHFLLILNCTSKQSLFFQLMPI